MKKFIIIVSAIVALAFGLDAAYYHYGWYIDWNPKQEVTTFTRTDDHQIYLDRGNGYEPFEIKGVNMGSGIPGEWATDFAVDHDTYLRWFRQIQEMGANTIRVYTVQNDTFYNAFYEYNRDNPDPLWLIHGVWVNDYIQNSHRDAYAPEFYDTFLESCKTTVDVIHGTKKISMGRMASAGSGFYSRDISPWVIGYILGVEWEDITVAYTDELYKNRPEYTSYEGKYMFSAPEATPFEVMLTKVGDKVIEYESERYKQQRLVAFSNWPTTDPFDYPKQISRFFMKCAKVDVEHIRTTDRFLSGQFASYHVYPYYPDYLAYMQDLSWFGLEHPEQFLTDHGTINTYRAYLSLLTRHHNMPVVISEFGVSTGRGMAQRDRNTGRNQGNMSETEQGYALVECYEDIRSVGCAGGCVFTWQDEWFKRTWNTMYAVNLKRDPYWSDYQTNEQYFGLLSFDPGEETCVCYVDGDLSEWTENDVVYRTDHSALSMKYDEKFLYFLAYQEGFDLNKNQLFLPIDITPKSGSSYSRNYGILFDRPVDFLIAIDGKKESRVLVQERYEALRSTYSQNVYGFDTYEKGNIPDPDSPRFIRINMILQTATQLLYMDDRALADVFETGLLTYGTANPEDPDYNSLADFMDNGEYVELKLPWQLLNFSDPSRMTIHDDYYDGNYGVEYITIDGIYVGLTNGLDYSRTPMEFVELKGWHNKVTYHERLKPSYQILQNAWRTEP